MESFLKRLNSLEERDFFLAMNPDGLELVAARGEFPTQVVVVRTEATEGESGVSIVVEEGARMNLVEIFMSPCRSSVEVRQERGSQLHATALQLGDSTTSYEVNLCGDGAECDVNILQLASAKDRVVSNLRIAHNVPRCESRSTSKCVASGESVGEFHGLVYVAQDAQQSLSQQSSRNIALSRGAKIVAEPQLEIYADDVKCTHGATVGQMNKDAILYMRQRGLSEEQARRVQLDGFVSEVVAQSGVESIREALMEVVSNHLYNI